MDPKKKPLVLVKVGQKQVIEETQELVFPRYSRHVLDEGTWYMRLDVANVAPTVKPSVVAPAGLFVHDRIWIGATADNRVEVEHEILAEIPSVEAEYYYGLGGFASDASSFGTAWSRANSLLQEVFPKENLQELEDKAIDEEAAMLAQFESGNISPA